MNATNRTSRPRRRRSAVIAALVLLAVTAVQPWSPLTGVVVADAQTGRPATMPESLVREVVELDGAVYAGDCSDTVSPRDIGKTCSKVVAERSDVRAYLIGRTFSEFSRWVFVRRGRDGWRAAGTAPLDFFAPSPEIPWPQ